jgi:histidinol-phosphate aminotransferase
LEDEAFVQKSFELNRAGMKQLTDGFRSLGLEWIPSFANFVAVKVEDAPGTYQKLLSKGVIVRPIGGYKLPNHLRVSIGLEPENARFLTVLGNVIAGRE